MDISEKVKIVSLIDYTLNQGKQIFLLDFEDSLLKGKFIERCKKMSSDLEIWVKSENNFEGDFVRSISGREFSTIKSIYDLYEFNDKFTLISKDNNYASIFNYIEQGILDENELIEAILFNVG